MHLFGANSRSQWKGCSQGHFHVIISSTKPLVCNLFLRLGWRGASFMIFRRFRGLHFRCYWALDVSRWTGDTGTAALGPRCRFRERPHTYRLQGPVRIEKGKYFGRIQAEWRVVMRPRFQNMPPLEFPRTRGAETCVRSCRAAGWRGGEQYP
jgi:hypothetical protein